MRPATKTRFTIREYLAVEAVSDSKHEYVDGEIVAMAGATVLHNLVAGNVAHALRRALESQPCMVLPSDQRVFIEAANRFSYPDVTVVCGAPRIAPNDPLAVENPVLLVEVLSPSTDRYDVGEKFDDYRKLPSLADFLTVRTDRAEATLWERTEVGRWSPTDIAGPEATVTVERLGIRFPLGDAYLKAELMPPGSA